MLVISNTARVLLACALLFCATPGKGAVGLPGAQVTFLETEDPSGTLTLPDFLALPESTLSPRTAVRAHGYTPSSFWARVLIPASLFSGGDLWLQLSPVFLDQLTVYRQSQDAPGEWRPQELGDLSIGQRGDVDYRLPVLSLPAPSADSAGQELIFHYRSSSAVLLGGELWEPEAFLAQASRDTAFWSFYFGLAVLSTGLAILLALLTRRKLVWLLCLFSSTYLLVACVQGYVDWLIGPTVLHLQHYMTSVLTLTSYGCLFWMCAEALNTRQYVPRLHRLLMAMIALIFLSLISIPLDLYGTAIHLQFFLCTIAILILGGVSLHGLGRSHQSRVERGFSLAAIWYLLTAVIALLTLFGAIPFHKHLYALWQYGLVVNTLIVLTLVIVNVVNEERLEKTRLQLAYDLKVSREARFHQRQFMGMVAHEFRTPLSIISAALANLGNTTLDAAQRKRREINIARANERLVQLTDNCLADSRLDATHLNLEYGPTDVRRLIDSAGAIARLSPDHTLDVQVDLPASRDAEALATQLQTDTGLLRIALSNLLDNAVKYSTGGEIRVRAILAPPALTVSVCDPGPGIAQSAVSGLFERFQRGQEDRAGVGLGLYVAQEIARAHGGDLVLAHNTSTGCCFELRVLCREAGRPHV